MKHFDYEINLFLDGELQEENRKELFAHLAECEECTNIFLDYLSLKEKTRNYFAGNITHLKNKPSGHNRFYKYAFYTAAAASIIFVMLLLNGKPKTQYITKNEVRVDTVFVQKESPSSKNKTTRINPFTVGKKVLPEELSQKAYVNYVKGLRSIVFSKSNKNNNEGSL